MRIEVDVNPVLLLAESGRSRGLGGGYLGRLRRWCDTHRRERKIRFMRKFFSALFVLLLFWLSWGWKVLDYIGRGEVFVGLNETFDRLTGFVSRHQEIGYQVAPWVIMVAAILFMALLQWRGLLTFWRRNKHEEEPPSVNRSFDVVSFRRDDGALLPNSTNATNVLKNAPNVFTAYTGKPIDHSVLCIAMTNTPTLQTFEINPTGTAVTFIWPTNIELPDTLSIRIQK